MDAYVQYKYIRYPESVLNTLSSKFGCVTELQKSADNETTVAITNMNFDAKAFLFAHFEKSGGPSTSLPITIHLENKLAPLFRQSLFLSYLEQRLNVKLHVELDAEPYSVVISGDLVNCNSCRTHIVNMNSNIVDVEDAIESDVVSIFPKFLSLCRTFDFPHSLVQSIVINCAPQIFHVLLRFLQSFENESASHTATQSKKESMPSCSSNELPQTSNSSYNPIHICELDLLSDALNVADKLSPCQATQPNENLNHSFGNARKMRSFSFSASPNEPSSSKVDNDLHGEQLPLDTHNIDVVRPFERSISLSDDEDNNLQNHVVRWRPTVTVDVSHLRPVIIDGQNVASMYRINQFTPKALLYAVRYFQDRGHEHITVLVPKSFIHNALVRRLHDANLLRYFPKRVINGQVQEANNEQCIIETAMQVDGVILSNNQFRDVISRRPKQRKFIEGRLLMYYFSGEALIIPQYVHGMKHCPLEEILSKQPSGKEPTKLAPNRNPSANTRFRHSSETSQGLRTVAPIDMAEEDYKPTPPRFSPKQKPKRKNRKGRRPSS